VCLPIWAFFVKVDVSDAESVENMVAATSKILLKRLTNEMQKPGNIRALMLCKDETSHDNKLSHRGMIIPGEPLAH
jgi:hypothetical protein